MPTSSKPESSAIHRVLIDSGADPKLIHPAIEEMRHLSGQNVTTAIGARITGLRFDLQAQITELRGEMQTQFTALRTEMSALKKFTWTLVSLLAIPMLGLLYKILTAWPKPIVVGIRQGHVVESPE